MRRHISGSSPKCRARVSATLSVWGKADHDAGVHSRDSKGLMSAKGNRVSCYTVRMKTTLALKVLVIALAAAYLSLCVLAFAFQKKLIYLPDLTPMQDCPAYVEAEGEIVTSGSLRGYHFRSSPEKAVVLYHGNGGRACNRIILLPELSSGGASVLFVEYDGYAGKGTASKETLLRNVDDTIAFLETSGYSDVVIVGESIGNGPAAYHASKAPVSRVIMITPYSELADVAAYHYSLLPIRMFLTENYRPADWLSAYTRSVRIAVAGNDEVIPAGQGESLYESLPALDKKMLVVEGAGHNTIYGYPELTAFLRESVAGR